MTKNPSESDGLDRFAELLKAQRDLQIESFDLDPAQLEGEELMEFIRWNTLAATAELHETLEETGWKPWATSRHVNVDAAIGELVDTWHFFVNLLWAVSGTTDPEELAAEFTARYYAKRSVNAARQRDGYDGVSGKCRGCKRDLAETGVDKLGDFHCCHGCGCEVLTA